MVNLLYDIWHIIIIGNIALFILFFYRFEIGVGVYIGWGGSILLVVGGLLYSIFAGKEGCNSRCALFNSYLPIAGNKYDFPCKQMTIMTKSCSSIVLYSSDRKQQPPYRISEANIVLPSEAPVKQTYVVSSQRTEGGQSRKSKASSDSQVSNVTEISRKTKPFATNAYVWPITTVHINGNKGDTNEWMFPGTFGIQEWNKLVVFLMMLKVYLTVLTKTTIMKLFFCILMFICIWQLNNILCLLKLCIVLIKVMSYELRSLLRLKHCVSHRVWGTGCICVLISSFQKQPWNRAETAPEQVGCVGKNNS